MGRHVSRSIVVVDHHTETALRFRGLIHSEIGLAHWERCERRQELAELGRDGVREIRRRLALVRAAKREAAVRHGREILTPAELDAILPAVNCRRTRDRLQRSG
jgi:hypothetical protein